jgi:hypothetical protein
MVWGRGGRRSGTKRVRVADRRSDRCQRNCTPGCIATDGGATLCILMRRCAGQLRTCSLPFPSLPRALSYFACANSSQARMCCVRHVALIDAISPQCRTQHYTHLFRLRNNEPQLPINPGQAFRPSPRCQRCTRSSSRAGSRGSEGMHTVERRDSLIAFDDPFRDSPPPSSIEKL